MRGILIFLYVGISIPTLGQKPLVITDARKANPVAPYVYYLQDFTHKLTYEQVSRFPLDSFTVLNQKDIIQLAYRTGTLWLRFQIKNQTEEELILNSTPRGYERLDVHVLDDSGNMTLHKVGNNESLANRLAPTAQISVPLGRNPELVHIAMFAPGAIGDYLYVANAGNTVLYRKKTSFWQGIVLGVFLLVLLNASFLYWRLRDSLIGWYALYIFSVVQFFLFFYGIWHEILGDVYYQVLKFYPANIIFQLCWALLFIHFLQLRQYAKPLYYLLICLVVLTISDHTVRLLLSVILEVKFSPLGSLLEWLGLDWGIYFIFNSICQFVSLIYVSQKRVRLLQLYALGFGFSKVAMLIAFFALYNISWLPYLPFNNIWVVGNLIEIVILAYALAERANEHRRQQNQTQQALIDQLQENLRQRDKLLHIRDEIARDLHDEVGATLTSIAISTRLVQKKVGTEWPEISPLLDQIKTDSEDTIHSIRNTVWALNPENDKPEKFLDRLRSVALQMLANQTFTFSYVCNVSPDSLPSFSMEQCRNIYLIFKEAIHNILKHAGASRVNIIIDQEGDQLRIRIIDNGAGFDTSLTTEGNGLRNFRKRAMEGGFTVTISSGRGKGTNVEVCVPIQQSTTAFARRAWQHTTST